MVIRTIDLIIIGKSSGCPISSSPIFISHPASARPRKASVRWRAALHQGDVGFLTVLVTGVGGRGWGNIIGKVGAHRLHRVAQEPTPVVGSHPPGRLVGPEIQQLLHGRLLAGRAGTRRHRTTGCERHARGEYGGARRQREAANARHCCRTPSKTCSTSVTCSTVFSAGACPHPAIVTTVAHGPLERIYSAVSASSRSLVSPRRHSTGRSRLSYAGHWS